MPDVNRPFLIEANASKYISEVVLCQEDENKKLYLCTFIIKIFSSIEQKYTIYNRELSKNRDIIFWSQILLL